ncbi:MAG: hypothetical protein P1U56_25770 [Saprospiraceae bacterium]|nr:hypothetical protein [Saprospiraceae bacterium]
MEYKKSLKKEISAKVDNCNSYTDEIKKLSQVLKTRINEITSIQQIEPLRNDQKQLIISELVKRGILKKFFTKKNRANNFDEIIEDIKNVIKTTLTTNDEPTDTKFKSVIWLRDDEIPSDSYSNYVLGNGNEELFAKVGLNQRSYKLWSNGNEGDYIEVYYNHLKHLKNHSFFPHNDRRFSQIMSNFMSMNSEAREYLMKRKEVWKTLYSSNNFAVKSSLEYLYAFGYTIKNIDTSNRVNLIINNKSGGWKISLDCQLKLSRNEFDDVLKQYGSFNVKEGISISIHFGEITAPSQPKRKKAVVNGVNAFYKLSENIKNSKDSISSTLNKHSALITAELGDDVIYKIFLDCMISKINTKLASYNNRSKIKTVLNLIEPKIPLLQREIERLNSADDLNKEKRIIYRIKAELSDWYDTHVLKLKTLEEKGKNDNTLNNRDL